MHWTICDRYVCWADVLRVLGIAICTKARDCQKRKPATDPTSRRALALADGRPPGGSVARAHHTDRALLPVGTGLYLEGDQLMESGPHPVPWKRGNVNEEVGRAFGWRDEAEATIVVPLRQSSMGSHEGGLTARAIGAFGRETSFKLQRLSQSRLTPR